MPLLGAPSSTEVRCKACFATPTLNSRMLGLAPFKARRKATGMTPWKCMSGTPTLSIALSRTTALGAQVGERRTSRDGWMDGWMDVPRRARPVTAHLRKPEFEPNQTGAIIMFFGKRFPGNSSDCQRQFNIVRPPPRTTYSAAYSTVPHSDRRCLDE